MRTPAPLITALALGALVELPGGGTEEEVVARAAAHGLAIDGLGTYTAPGQRHAPALVVGYGRPPDHAFTTALARLRTVLGG